MYNGCSLFANQNVQGREAEEKLEKTFQQPDDVFNILFQKTKYSIGEMKSVQRRRLATSIFSTAFFGRYEHTDRI